MSACVSRDGSKGRVPPACGACDPRTSQCTSHAHACGLLTCRWQALTRQARQGLLHQPLSAQDGEVACGLQPLVVRRSPPLLPAGHTHGHLLPEGGDLYTLFPLLGTCL